MREKIGNGGQVTRRGDLDGTLPFRYNGGVEEDGSRTQALRKEAARGMEAVVERLKSQRAFTGAIVDNLPLAVFCKNVDDGYRFVLWNKRQEEITGISRDEAIGKDDHELFGSKAADYFREIDEKIVRSGESLKIPEEKISSPTIGKAWLRTLKSPITGPDGTSLILGVSEDITREIQERELLARTSEQLESAEEQLIHAEKLESIGRLAAGVAHEVKNPLACLLMGAQYLERATENPSEDMVAVIAEMKAAVERADQIVRGLVDFSAHRKLELEPLDPRIWIESALGYVRHECLRSHVTPCCDFQHEDALVPVDSARMEQVLVNLLINSIHAMEGHSKKEITLKTFVEDVGEVEPDEGGRSGNRLRSGDQLLCIEVQDTGPGFPEDKVSEVFEPFFTTKPTGKGTGLGMSVARKILQLHGGRIDISNRPTEEGGGAVVRMALKTAS